MKSTLNRAGDTLVEVMIALAIISSVIGIAYATASRSLRIGLQAQDRLTALKLVEGQIETLKGLLSNPTVRANVYAANKFNRNPGSSNSFCVNGSTIYEQDMISTDVISDSLEFNNSASVSGGNPVGSQVYHYYCSVGNASEQRYKLSIEREDSGTLSTFIVRARWERIGGGQDETKISYGLNRGQYE